MKKAVSILLTVAMLLSCFSFVMAEDAVEAVVTATVSGSDLTNATDVALSFRAVITFPSAIAADADLSGIVITGGEEDLAPARITKGAETEGTINSVVIDTPYLKNATTYTLVVPALGENEAKSFDFTTVPENYIIKEDFVGGYSATWVKKMESLLSKLVLADKSVLKDTDGDGIVDMMGEISGGNQNTVWLPTSANLADVNEMVVETRVKYTDRTGKGYVLEDGSLKDDGDKINGGLFLIRGSFHNNYIFSFRTNAEGYLTYGGEAGRGFTTDYKIYNDKWYTVRVVFAENEATGSVYITDDDGNSYQGPLKSTQFGNSYPVNPLTDIKFSYNWFIKSNVDYINVWANDGFGEVTSTINGAVDLSTDDKDVTLTFAEEITEADIAKISVGDGATVNATLADSKTVNLAISDLAYETEYEINVPQLGLNKAKVFTFATEKEPVPSLLINETNIEDKDNVAVVFNGTVSFVKPVATGTDLSGITLSTGDETADITVTEGAVTDGYFTTATFKTPVLKAGRTYTLSVPAIGSNEAKDISFNTVPLSYFVKEDFDGGYTSPITDQNYKDASTSLLTDTDGDGIKDAMNPISGGNYNTLYFPTRLSLADTKGLTVETRVKYTDRTGTGFVLEDGSIKNDRNTSNGGLMRIVGPAQNNTYYIGTNEEGYFSYGVDGLGHVSDFKIYNDKWYTFKIEFDENEVNAAITVTDDDGNTYTGPLTQNRWGASWPINPLDHINYSYNWHIKSTVDYLYVYDREYKGKVNVTYNGSDLDGATNVPVGEALEVIATFDSAITEEQLSQINVAGATVESVLSEDGFTATLTISDLTEYEKAYILNIPEFGINEAKTVSFTTEKEPVSMKAKLTQNGARVDAKNDMPLGFTPELLFAAALADATDLSGITIARKDGADTTATAVATQGKVTDGFFTTAKVAIGNLENDTEYVLTVPAIGTNEATTFTFKTIASPYYLKETADDGYIRNDWYNSNKYVDRISTPTDTNNDGVGDAIFNDGYNHLVAKPAKSIGGSAGEFTVETRVKYGAGRSGLAVSANEDGTIKGNTDVNNGGLLRIRGTAISSWSRLNVTSDGYLTYGNTDGDKYNTGYKLELDKWYTFRITSSADGKTFKVFVTDDEGNSYVGPFITTSYNGTVMRGLLAVEYAYGMYYSTTVDYLNVWDNAASLGAVNVTCNEEDLNGALIEKAETAEIKFAFENAVTADDLDKIKFIGDAVVDSMTLSEDGFTATMVLSGLEYGEKYIIITEAIGKNVAKVISFGVQAPPAPVITYGEEADFLNGATDVPKAFNANMSFKWAIEEGTDLSGIVIDNGGVLKATYLDENTVGLAISNLDYDKTYTISIPEFAPHSAGAVKFRTYDGFMFRGEFNGDETDYGYALAVNESLSNPDTTATVSGGMLSIAKSHTGHTTAMYFDEKADAADVDEFVVDMRVRWHANVGAREDGLISSGKKLLRVRYNDTYAQMAISAIGGKLAYGGSGDNAEAGVTLTDYDMLENMWYTIKFVYHKATNTMDLTLTPDEGEAFTVTGAAAAIHNMQGVTDIQFGYRYQICTDVDYIRIYENKEGEFATPAFSKTEVKEGEEIEIDADYINYTGTDDISLIVALYGADGKMTRILEPETVETAIGANELSTKVTPLKGETKIRAFVWKGGLEKMIPMTLPNQIGE